jgi:hypothetical protein
MLQTGHPVLVGADVASTYGYLLSPEEHRDADTWGVRLLEVRVRGLQPDTTLADFAGVCVPAKPRPGPTSPVAATSSMPYGSVSVGTVMEFVVRLAGSDFDRSQD